MSAGCVEPRGTLRPVSLSTGAPFTRGFIAIANASVAVSESSYERGARLPAVGSSGANAECVVALPPTSAVPEIVTREAAVAEVAMASSVMASSSLSAGMTSGVGVAVTPAGSPVSVSAIGPLKLPVRMAFTIIGVFAPSGKFNF